MEPELELYSLWRGNPLEHQSISVGTVFYLVGSESKFVIVAKASRTTKEIIALFKDG